ncbi:hypothetical protein [Leifsonia xyli]|uniref:hypothetical protein n=1 Tax=Leifsonia xyli TaxID=1575 RepID=UPI00146FBE57|nr:hypothetical protein [Leifsonia xyli]
MAKRQQAVGSQLDVPAVRTLGQAERRLQPLSRLRVVSRVERGKGALQPELGRLVLGKVGLAEETC